MMGPSSGQSVGGKEEEHMMEKSMKRMHKKLALKKESLRRLTEKELQGIAGGADDPTADCTIWTCLVGP
jgi:hypothetical protein